jgi:hypothetical protein
MTFADARKLFFAYWWILPLALVLILVLNYVFCGGSGPDKKDQQIQSNIDQQKGVNAVIGNLVTNQEQVVNNAANNTNQAVNDFHNSVNRDSSTFGGNSTERFCQRFPCDSTCAEWRKQRPEIICQR